MLLRNPSEGRIIHLPFPYEIRILVFFSRIGQPELFRVHRTLKRGLYSFKAKKRNAITCESQKRLSLWRRRRRWRLWKQAFVGESSQRGNVVFDVGPSAARLWKAGGELSAPLLHISHHLKRNVAQRSLTAYSQSFQVIKTSLHVHCLLSSAWLQAGSTLPSSVPQKLDRIRSDIMWIKMERIWQRLWADDPVLQNVPGETPHSWAQEHWLKNKISFIVKT